MRIKKPKGFLLFWVYDGNFFLGGGITQFKKDGIRELRIRKQNHPDAVIYWEEDRNYTYDEARNIAFIVAKTVQRLQPGIREAVRDTPAIARAALQRLGIPTPSREHNLQKAFGNELTEKILAVGQVDRLEKPDEIKQLEATKDE